MVSDAFWLCTVLQAGGVFGPLYADVLNKL